MSLSFPRVRDACQNCHRRKIRCHLIPGNSSCQHCSSNGTACLFAPRARAGRPRRSNADTQRNVQWELAKCPGTQAERGYAAPMLVPMEENFGLQHYWTPDKALGDVTDINFASHDHSNINAPQLPLKTSPLSPTLQTNFDFLLPDEAAVDFDTILRLCSDLDRYCRAVREGVMASKDMEVLLKLLESTGATARSSTSEKASNALILAALYKVFDLCEAVIRDVLNGGTDIMDSLYRLKRLDVVLLQAKIALNRMGHEEASKKSSEIHHWIESIVKQQQYQDVW